MYRFADQGRVDPIQFEVVSRTLDRRIRLRTLNPSVFESLRFLECTPDIVGPAPRDVVISIEPFRGYLRIIENGILIKEALGPPSVLQFLHVHLFACSIDDRPRSPLIHAACLRRGGRRLLLTGLKDAGKTTLTLRLIAAGFDIEADEHVFVTGAGVIARPRGCRVKEAALQHFPEVADVIAAAPFYQHATIGRIFNVDPRALGSAWRIEEGSIDHVIVLQPNHRGQSSIRPMQPSNLVRMLMREIGLRENGRGSAVAALAPMAGRTRAFDMSLGELKSAVRCVERVTRD